MNDFEIIKLDICDKVLIIIQTSESPFDYIKEITKNLKLINFNGTVIIDELLHSGNNNDRFICAEFVNGNFIHESFDFLCVPKKDPLRNYISNYLKNDSEYLELSGLTSAQRNLIENDYMI